MTDDEAETWVDFLIGDADELIDPPQSDAEMLIDIAESVIRPKDALMLVENEPECVGDTVALAMRLKQRPDLCFRALVEGWTRFQIVRELY